MSKLRFVPKPAQPKQRFNRPGQNTTLGDKFSKVLADIEPSDGSRMQTEEFWNEVWKP